MTGRPPPLVRLRPFFGTLHVSRGRSVLATGVDECITGQADHGLFVHNCRVRGARS